ncbi:MAG: hypothetical protein ACK4KT_01400 [Thermaurantimonas sp.]
MNALPILLPVMWGLITFGTAMSVYRTGLPLSMILLALFPWFLPLEWAVFIAACVHFLDYSVKFSVMKNRAKVKSVLTFGLPAMVGAWLGAGFFTDLINYSSIQIGESGISPFYVLFSGMLLLSAAAEWMTDSSGLIALHMPRGVAGVLCGMASGMSGVFDSFKKILYKPSDENFVQYSATMIVSSLFSDMMRIPVYLAMIHRPVSGAHVKPLAIAAVAGALIGIMVGLRYFKEAPNAVLRRWSLLAVGVSSLGILLKNLL